MVPLRHSHQAFVWPFVIRSARITAVTDGKPSDAYIIAIVDSVDLDGRLVYQKDRT